MMINVPQKTNQIPAARRYYQKFEMVHWGPGVALVTMSKADVCYTK